MVKIYVFRKNTKIVGFRGEGHSGYAEQGSDIVCAAISALTQNAVLGIIETLKLDAKFERQDGFLSLNLRELKLDKKSRDYADVILETLVKTLQGIENEYSAYFKLIEKEEKPNV
jgi:uncharacterized protein YsxB (DUF464 family)